MKLRVHCKSIDYQIPVDNCTRFTNDSINQMDSYMSYLDAATFTHDRQYYNEDKDDIYDKSIYYLNENI